MSPRPELASVVHEGRGGPLILELPQLPDVAATVRRFADWPDLILFDSPLQRPGLGRYSILTADPLQRWTRQTPQFGVDPFAELRSVLTPWQSESLPDEIPFGGGLAGMLGYELGRCFERLPTSRDDEFALPVAAVGWYDWALVWDHELHRASVIAQGWPETNPASRRSRADQRLRQVLATLDGPVAAETDRFRVPPLPTTDLAPQFSAPGLPNLTSNFSRPAYLAAVQSVIDRIYAGDIFQANMTQRLLHPYSGSPLDLYAALRRCNPATFAGLYLRDDWAVISASPERFLQVRNGEVDTRPIKGTRRRRPLPEADLYTRDELRESDKDQAENVMIVDLLRNDLSRVCAAGSVSVPQLCDVETYETVQHLVSAVRGRLRPGQGIWDLLAATWPGGSITGAPKVRAMEIITELEPTARGPYTGSLFYLTPDGGFDSNLLIRTFVQRSGWLQCSVGGGIVAQSDPADEYAETLHKAAGMLHALREARPR
ncbi:aminodeoxychorismate synthase component I [Planctellipticum variicoloris]|uniref:aminodeoxychorismate synthase component I n=1 Tax=Planctellipticum variicoloris TaxID=3064265 RepID=UPI003013654B|nr:aminodeoxychorismate synthase component I [Planctomycetaceae bacterium SH412]